MREMRSELRIVVEALAARAAANPNVRSLLKEQINIVVIGFGWIEFKTPWSCATDKTVGSLRDLIAKVEAMIMKSGKRPKPEEPPVDSQDTGYWYWVLGCVVYVYELCLFIAVIAVAELELELETQTELELQIKLIMNGTR